MNQIKEIVRKIIGDQSQKIEEIKKSKPEKPASSKEIYTPLLLQVKIFGFFFFISLLIIFSLSLL